MLRHLPRKRAALAIAVAAALISSSEQRASAAVRDWTAASGNFNTPANWSGTLVPVAGDTARFVNAATYTVTFDLNPTNAIAEVSAGTVTFRPDTVASRTYALSTLNLTGGSLTLADPTSGPNTLTLTATSLLNVANAALTLQGGNAISLAGILNVDAGGTLTVTGASSTLAQTSGSTNSVGAASGAAALVSVTTSGVLSTGTGLLNINPTGTVSVNGGTGSFNGSISVDGGRLERLTSTGFNLAAGKGVAASNNGQIAFTGSYTINNNTAFTLNTGADWSTTSFLDVGRIGTGSLTIDGLGSSVTASSTSFWGSAGNIATVSIRNRATANFGSLNLANDLNAATVATFETLGGATSTLSGSLSIGSGGGGAATVNVGSVSTTSTLTVGTSTTVGANSGTGAAELVIDPGGVFNAGTGTFTVSATGDVDVNSGGTFNASGNLNINFNGAAMTIFNGGNFTMPAARTLAVNSGGVFTNNNNWTTPNNTSVQANGGSLLSMPTRTLTITGGSALVAQSGGDVNVGILVLGDAAAGIGYTTITGAGSTLTASQATIGGGSGTSALAVSAGASASFAGPVAIGAGPAASSGQVSIDNASVSVGGDLHVGFSAVAAAVGIVSVTNNGTLTLADGAQANVGNIAVSGATGSLNLAFGGHVITGNDGFLNVNHDSQVYIDGGQFDANGNITVRGGHIERTTTAGGIFNWASPNHALLVNQGGSVTLNSTTLTPTNSSITLSDFSTLSLPGGGLSLAQNTTMNVNSGADFSANALDVGFGPFIDTVTARLIVDGLGSTVTSTVVSNWGVTTPGEVTFRNNASGSFNNLAVGASSVPTSRGTLFIQSGADLTVSGSLSVGTPGGGAGGAEGTVTLNGVGSTLSVGTVLGTLAVGATGGNVGTVNVENGATLTAGPVMLNPTGTINITAANAALGSVTANGGVIHFNSGALSLPGTVNIADGGVLGPSVNLTSNHLLTVGGITVAPAHTLTLSGGTLNTATLTNSGGTVALNSGTINITGGSGFTIGSGGGLGATLELGSQQNFNVSGVANIASDGTLVVNSGGQFSTGTNLVNGGEIRLGGGTARVTVGNVLQNSRLITGDGRIVGGVTNNAAGEIRVGNGQRIYLSAGSEQNSGKINLIGGTLETESGLTNNAGGTISGRGTLIAHGGTANAGNIQFSGGASDVFGLTVNNSGGKIIVSGNALATFYDAVFNNSGGEIRVSNGSTAVFFGDVTNQGTFAGTGTKFFESTSTGVLGAVASGGTTIVANGADVSAAYLREAALTVDGDIALTSGGGTSKVGALSVGEDGALDLSNNKMIVAHGNVGTFTGGAYSGLTGDIARAYDFGAWDLPGIKTTQADAGPTIGLTTIAINTADETFYAGNTFGGVAANSGDVLLMYTYAGDVNLDGLVDAADYGIIDNYFQFPGTSGYSNGDFNYDGIIDAGDYGIIDNAFQLQGAPIPVNSAIALSGVTAVPEPAACGFALIVAASTLMSRRRARCR